MSDFNTMTVAKLKAYASENGIDLGGATTKTKIVAILSGIDSKISEVSVDTKNKVIGSDKIVKEKRIPVSATKVNKENVLTTATADTFKDKVFNPVPDVDEEKVALYSEKNINWNGIGRMSKGYNIVTKEAAKKWLTLRGIREATPEEVASHYGL